MASPIFASHKNPNFSWFTFLKGAQFALLGSYRLLQNQLFFENSKYFKFTFTALQLSFLVQTILSIPIWILKSVCWILSWFSSSTTNQLTQQLSDKIHFYQADILNIQTLILLLIHVYYYEIFQCIFLDGMRFIDQVTLASRPNSLKFCPRSYSTGLTKSRRLLVFGESSFWNWIPLNLDEEQKYHCGLIFNEYFRVTLLNILLHLCSFLPKFGTLIITSVISTLLKSKLGARLSFLVFLMGLIVPSEVYIKLFSFLNIIQLTVSSLLNFSYFQRLGLTRFQILHWIESREGLIFGFGTVFYLMSWKLIYISVFVLFIEQLSLAYFISQVTDPIPDNITETWLLSQIYWTRIFNNLTVSNDGYKPIPGSFLLHKKSEFDTPNASTFMTPVSSITDMSKLDILS